MEEKVLMTIGKIEGIQALMSSRLAQMDTRLWRLEGSVHELISATKHQRKMRARAWKIGIGTLIGALIAIITRALHLIS